MTKSTLLIISLSLVSLWASLARADDSESPQFLMNEINQNGSAFVYENILIGVKWTTFLKKVESGESSWLQVAAAIYPATDGGPAEDLSSSVGVALVSSPLNVLKIALPVMGAGSVCGYPDLGSPKYDTQEKTISYLNSRISVIEKLSGNESWEAQEQCLKMLKKTRLEVLSPNGPFSSYPSSNTSLQPTSSLARLLG